MAKKIMSIDIGSSTVKMLFLGGSDDLIGEYIYVNPVGKNISLMSNSEKLVLIDLIRKNLDAIGGVQKVLVSVPEPLVYSKVMKFPRMSTPELSTAIKWELDQSVPFPPNEIEMSWSIMDDLGKKKGNDEMIVYVVATPTKIPEVYVQVFEALDLEISRLENESVSLQRALSVYVPESSLSLGVDLGSQGTNIVLMTRESIISSYYYAVGGYAMTKILSESFGLTLDQAENYKRTYGLLSDQLDGKVFKALKPIFDNLVLELKKMLISYRNDYGEIGQIRILLTGGGSYMTGLIPYLSGAMEGVEVVVANIFEGTTVLADNLPLGPVFTIAHGLTKEYGN